MNNPYLYPKEPSTYFPKETAIVSQEQERERRTCGGLFRHTHTRTRRALGCKGKPTRIKAYLRTVFCMQMAPSIAEMQSWITSKLLAMSSADVLCWAHNCFTAAHLRLGGSTWPLIHLFTQPPPEPNMRYASRLPTVKTRNMWTVFVIPPQHTDLQHQEKNPSNPG